MTRRTSSTRRSSTSGQTRSSQLEVKTGADRTLIFLTLCVQQVSRRLGGARWRLRERVAPRARADDCELDRAGGGSSRHTRTQALKECEQSPTKAEGAKKLEALKMKKVCAPGDAGWPLGTMFPQPANASEADTWRSYMKQAREEVGLRIIEKVYYADGSKNKWWQCFSKRKFMGKELRA